MYLCISSNTNTGTMLLRMMQRQICIETTVELLMALLSIYFDKELAYIPLI